MRRGEQEITDQSEIESIISRAQVCRIAFLSQGEPYIVPVCFGYRQGAFYFHCAPEGRKLDMLGPGVKVCFELEADVAVLEAKSACAWGMAYSSVIGWGSASRVSDESERSAALDAIMSHYGGQSGPYNQKTLGRTAVVRIDIESLSCKSSQPPPQTATRTDG